MGAGASVSIPDHLADEHKSLLEQGLSEDEVNSIIGLVEQDYQKIKADRPELSDAEINAMLKEKFKNFEHHYGIAPGMYVRNDAEIPVLFMLSRETPLHWVKLEPGQVYHVKCGRVFFDVSAEPWTEGCEPTGAGITAEVAALTVGITASAAIILVGGLVIGGAIGAAAITAESTALKHALLSKKSAKISEVCADGRIAVISGNVSGEGEGCAQTYELSITLFNEHGHLTSLGGSNPEVQNYQQNQYFVQYQAVFVPNDAEGGAEESRVVGANETNV